MATGVEKCKDLLAQISNLVSIEEDIRKHPGLSTFFKLVPAANAVQAMVQDAPAALEEVKALTPEEAGQLVAALFQTVLDKIAEFRAA